MNTPSCARFSTHLPRSHFHKHRLHISPLSRQLVSPRNSSHFGLPRFARRPRPLLLGREALRLSWMPTIPFLTVFSSSEKKMADQKEFPDQRTNEEWRAVLTKEQFHILRNKGTEPAGSGKYNKHSPASGVYECAGCGAPLYKASHKFSSGCGWPAYFDSIPGAVTRKEDRSFGMSRTEIMCSNCGGHLGHVFKGEGYPTPTDERHCVNSISLRFTESEAKASAKEVEMEGGSK
ncbi:peptide methionine sulfoxide reductase msrB [Histoplasma ohiense]|nr:peptide methionine sulfoxide reductase msrB [Histoplasma ohiense (nom. inval.)]